MSEEKSPREELNDLLAQARSDLFEAEEKDLTKIEERYEGLQREIMYLRTLSRIVQEAALKLARRKLDTLEELTLFQGAMFRVLSVTLRDELGADSDEVYRILFGDAAEDDPAVTYTNMCMKFAEAAEDMQAAADDLAESRRKHDAAKFFDSLFSAAAEARVSDPSVDKKDLN